MSVDVDALLKLTQPLPGRMRTPMQIHLRDALRELKELRGAEKTLTERADHWRMRHDQKEADNERLRGQLHAMGKLKDGYGEDGVAQCLDEQNKTIERLRGLLQTKTHLLEEAERRHIFDRWDDWRLRTKRALEDKP